MEAFQPCQAGQTSTQVSFIFNTSRSYTYWAPSLVLCTLVRTFPSIRWSPFTQKLAVSPEKLVYTPGIIKKSQDHVRSILDCVKSVGSKEAIKKMDGKGV